MKDQVKPASTAIVIESLEEQIKKETGHDWPLSTKILAPLTEKVQIEQSQQQPELYVIKDQVLPQVQQPILVVSATQQQPPTTAAHQQTSPTTSEVQVGCQEQSENLLNTLLEESEFEKQCRHNLNHQYKNWKTNGWGKSPICIPDAVEVNETWFYRTLDPQAADYGKRVTQEKAEKLKGALAERDVHQAFQKSTIGGILIHGLDFGTLWKKLKLSIPPEIYQQLEPYSRTGSFEIDFLLFHPVCGMVIMECKSADMARSGKKVYKKHKKTQKETIKKVLNVFKILTRTDFPPGFVHGLLCFPNSEKTNIIESEHGSILDIFDLTDEYRFDSFWDARLLAALHLPNLYENFAICRFIAMAFGCRAAKFISLGCNALEIYRIIDSHESSRHLNQTISFNAANASIESSTSTKKIFLNSEQLKVYEAAKNNSNMVIYGPPGCGKTLLVMMLAKEAAKLEKPGRVVIILAYNELAAIFENFFNANKSKQKRTIIINPSSNEIEKSLATKSYDDIFSDEVYYGGWIPRKKRKNGRIVVGLTVGRQHRKWSMTCVAENLKLQLKGADFDFFELKTVMRNTVNICEYYQQYMELNGIHIGHNIRGRAVKVEKCNNVKGACLFIIDQIRQFLNKSDSLRQDYPMLLPKDIVVLVCHEPVLSQIKQIKRSLRKAGIDVGSITEQLQQSSIKPLVAVDCSANALSCEWPIVFVIDASNCPYSQSVSSPIVACTRAVCALFVLDTQKCNFPQYENRMCPILSVCSKVFPNILLPFQKYQDSFHQTDLANEFNLNRTTRLTLNAFFWFFWFYSFIFIPALPAINMVTLWFCPGNDIIGSTMFSVWFLIYLFLDVYCACASLLTHQESMSLLWSIFYFCSIFFLFVAVNVPSSSFDIQKFFISLFFVLVLFVMERFFFSCALKLAMRGLSLAVTLKKPTKHYIRFKFF